MFLYLAGPMRGYDKFNFPAFDQWQEWLEKQGHKVISPAQMDRDKNEEPEFDENKAPVLPEGFMERAMRRDVAALMQVEGIALMPGWEQSKGVEFELQIAKNLGLDIWHLGESTGYRYMTHTSWIEAWKIKTPTVVGKSSNDSELEALLAEEEELERQAGLRAKKEAPLSPKDYFGVPENDVFDMAKKRIAEERVTNATTGGQKGQKLQRYDLIPPGPLCQLAEHYGRGAQKYDDRNWEKGYDWSLTFAAMQRHAWEWWAGEDLDPDTGGHHMAAVAWHAFALLEYANTHTELDNRP